jgi:putative ABC transport system permease protein
MITDFTLIGRSLRVRLFSTVMAALIVALAVCLLLVRVTLHHAGRAASNRGSGNMQLLVSADVTPRAAVLNGVFHANPPSRVLKWPACQELLKKYPVEFAIPIQQLDGYQGFPIVATQPQFFSLFNPADTEQWTLADGALFKSEFDVVAGASAAKTLQLKVGDVFQLPRHGNAKYKISGILLPTGTSHDRALFTDLNGAWLAREMEKRKLTDPGATQTTAASLSDSNKLVTAVYVRFKNGPGSDAPALLSAYDDLKHNHPELTVALPANEIDKLVALTSTLDTVFMAMSGLLILFGAIAILLALFNSIEKRRQKAAVLRVMGCSQARIFGLVVTEAAVIGLFGALGGVALSLAVNPLAAAVLDAKFGLSIQPEPQTLPTLMILLAAVILSGATGILPGLLASRSIFPATLRSVDPAHLRTQT